MATLTGTETETTTAAQRPRRWRREKYNRKEALAGLLFISPWIIGFSVFTVISMTWSLRLSFSDYDLATNSGEPVGFDNYRLLFDDPKVLTSLGNTFFYVLLAVPLEMIRFPFGVATGLPTGASWRSPAWTSWVVIDNLLID